jgi:hypothetical protein
MTEQTIGTPAQLPQERNPVELEFHDTPRLWVAYRGCGCEECPKGFGKTKEEADCRPRRVHCHRAFLRTVATCLLQRDRPLCRAVAAESHRRRPHRARRRR